MKTIGIGTDLIEIERIKKAAEKNPRFLDRILTQKEKDYCLKKKSFDSIAARFAAKEAVAKALGTGFSCFSFLDIEILNDSTGKPEVYLYNKAKKVYEEKKGQEILLTLSHSKGYALAFVIVQGE